MPTAICSPSFNFATIGSGGFLSSVIRKQEYGLKWGGFLDDSGDKYAVQAGAKVQSLGWRPWRRWQPTPKFTWRIHRQRPDGLSP